MKTKISEFMMKPKQVTLFMLSVLMLTSCGGKKQNGMGGIPEYAVVTLQPSSAELNSSYPATIKGKQDIEIRPKVAGFITQLCVDEGSTVRKGQTLFIIDPVQYNAAVKVAEANVKVAEAGVATARLTAQNKKELEKKNIISSYDLQMAMNQLATQEAVLAQAKAQLVNARQDLSYTTITSPSNGVVGSIPFRVGSLVSSSTTTPLTTVSDISEMYVYFSMTEKQLLGMIRQDGSTKEILGNMPMVELSLADGSIYPEKGKIETLSGVINQSTGAVSIRATFPNAQFLLRSGGTGSILIPYSKTDAIIIPQKATFEVQDKKFAYVLQDDSTVKNTPVEVLSLNDGQNFVVTSGLKAGDKIVIEGVGTLKDGTQIKAITPEESAAKLKAMSQQQQGGAGAAKR